MSKDKGLVPGFQPISRIIPARHSNRDNRLHDNSPLEAGPTFLPDKAISYQNPYVAKVQAVAPRFQGVPKHVSILIVARKSGSASADAFLSSPWLKPGASRKDHR